MNINTMTMGQVITSTRQTPSTICGCIRPKMQLLY